MHVHKTDNDSWLTRNTNATISQPIPKRLQTILASRRLNCTIFITPFFPQFFQFTFFFKAKSCLIILFLLQMCPKRASFKFQNTTLLSYTHRHAEAGSKINFCHSSQNVRPYFLLDMKIHYI